MKPALVALALALATTLHASTAKAWGAEGHRITGYVAQALLKPKAAIRLRQIIPGGDLAGIALYMDVNKQALKVRLKHSDRWHYDDRPVCHDDTPLLGYCPGGDCASVRLREYVGRLGSEQTSVAEKRFAIRVLVHVLGDVHQPLHASDNEDSGGNALRVTLPGQQVPRRLHGVWDTDLVRTLVRGRSEQAVAKALVTEFSGTLPDVQRGHIRDWMADSYGLAQSLAYGALPGFACDAGGGDGDTLALPEAYFDASVPAVREQLFRAGARIALVLNRALNH